MKVQLDLTTEMANSLLYSKEKVSVELDLNQIASLVVVCRNSELRFLKTDDASTKCIALLVREIGDILSERFTEEAVRYAAARLADGGVK